MNSPQVSLFRKEVIEGRQDRLHGEVTIALPMRWQVIGYLFLAFLIAAVSFLSLASYSRVETVGGAVVLDRGVAPIVPTRSGILSELSAREGMAVSRGQSLAFVRAEEDMVGGTTAPQRVVDALAEQDDRLGRQSSLIIQASAAERQRLAAQQTGLSAEIASIDRQIDSQRRLVELSESEFNSVRNVAEQGFISRRDLESRESTLLSRRQQLSQLQQARAALQSDLAEGERAAAQVAAMAQSQAAGLASSRAELAQRLADVEAGRGYTLNSPIRGTVTAVTARPGQVVTPQQPLFVVVPDDATPRVELYIPTSAAGFLEIGQTVRVAVDAFPYQRFGTVEARISEISSAAIPRAGPDGTPIPVYLITAELGRNWVEAFGRRQPLLPGMTLTARIVTERQTLFEWLFEPVLAVRRR